MNTPELDKMTACRAQSQAQGEFLNWLMLEKDIVLAKWSNDSESVQDLYECPVSIEALLAEFHGIDLNKVEQERRAILDELATR